MKRRSRRRVYFQKREMDEENGLYYYGARYLDPKYSRWLSGDPALGDYIPKAPIDDEAKKHNENLPGMGGVFNVVNLHLYHYAGNNPVKYTDPDGREDIYFIYTYKDTVHDQKMKQSERSSIDDDIKWATSKGYTVKVIEAGTKKDILDAIADDEAKMIVTSGHGYDPKQVDGIQTHDRRILSPNDIKTAAKGENLKTVIFENCFQGDIEDKWEEAFGNNVDVVGWKGPTTTTETKSFNGWGMWGKQIYTLRGYMRKTLWDE